MYPEDLSEGEELISVIINSKDEIINHSIICKNSDKFSKLEEKIYDKYPELKNPGNSFYINGESIDRYKTLNQYKITDKSAIITIDMGES